MRKLKSYQVHGVDVQEVLDELIERADEFGLASEDDLVSVSVMPATTSIRIVTGPRKSEEAKVEVTVVFWSDR